MTYKTDLDYNLIDKPNLTDEELLKYIEENFFDKSLTKWSLKNIYVFLQILCKLEKVEPSVEQLIYILCNHKRLLNEACAGAGKTTMSKYKMAIANQCYGIRGADILAIAYNTHAAEDVKQKYTSLARKLNNAARGKFHIDTDIDARTVHSWAYRWVLEYKERWNMVNILVLTPEEEIWYMRAAMVQYLQSIEFSYPPTDGMVNSAIQLYNWIRETLTLDKTQEWILCSSRKDLNMLSDKDLMEIFKRYDGKKGIGRKMDYQDMIQKMYELVTDKQICERLRKAYKYVVFDEYQDATPSMLRILKVMFEGDPLFGIPRYEEGTLVCIGDGDQSIYGFRGTDSDNCIRFRDDYKDATITAMSINRRCDNVVLDYARKVIESNVHRIEKPIRGLHTGGKLELEYYTNDTEEITILIDRLRKLPTLNKSVICYRNLASSQYITVKLLEAGIPINIARGIEPFTDLYSRSITDMLTLLEYPDIPDYMEKVLYKYVPRGPSFTKEGLRIIFKEYSDKLKTSRRGNFVDKIPFWEINYGNWYEQRGFAEILNQLKQMHYALKNKIKMSIYMPDLINLLNRYYINSMRKTLFADKLTDEYIQFINRYYTQDISYTDFKKKHRKMLQSMQDTKAMGINLTTMHGLKGLEFDNVFIIDMDDKLYPGNELKDSSLTPDQRTHIELESRRLLYVTLTRARHNLVLFFNKNCPSRYLKFFMDNTDLEELYKVSESMSMVDYNPSINKTMQEFDTTYKDSEFIYEDECDTTFIKPEPLKEENKQEIVKQEEQTVVNVDDEAWDGLLADVNADNLSIDDEDLFTSLFSIDTNSDDVDFDSIYDDGAVDSTSIVNSSKQSDDVDFDSLFDNDTVNDNEVDVASFVSDSDVASNENNSTVDDSISVLGLTVESKEMASLLNDVIEGNMPQPKPDFRWAETDDTNKPKLNTILGLLRSRDNNE